MIRLCRFYNAANKLAESGSSSSADNPKRKNGDKQIIEHHIRNACCCGNIKTELRLACCGKQALKFILQNIKRQTNSNYSAVKH